MKKITLSAAIVAAMTATGASAATLTIDGNQASFFTMGGGQSVSSPGFDGQFISGFNGLIVDGTTIQDASGAHGGAPDGTESPDIDNPWAFFGNTGMHQTTSPISVLSQSGNSATLDFSGWNVTWNTVESIPMGSGAWNGNPEGVAELTCGVDCTDGDSYVLEYSATVPSGDPSGFGDVQYLLHLEGTITGGNLEVAAVPVPAAVWLFGSGLLGLVGVARRKKA